MDGSLKKINTLMIFLTDYPTCGTFLSGIFVVYYTLGLFEFTPTHEGGTMSDNQDGFAKSYSDSGFWEKLKGYALVAGKEVIEKALWLYYAFGEKDTPAWAKTVIVGALGYFISPIDAIPDITPVVGYADDLGVLAAALATVSAYINADVKKKASRKLRDWFGDGEPESAA